MIDSVSAITRDITERNRAEAALRLRSELIHQAHERFLRHWRGARGISSKRVLCVCCSPALQRPAQPSDDPRDVAGADIAAPADARRPDRRHPHEAALHQLECVQRWE